MTKPSFQLGNSLPTIVAPPLRLRWLTAADLPALFTIFSDPEVTRYWGTARFQGLADAQPLLDDIHAHFHAGTLFQWGIELAGEANARETTGEIIGTCTLAALDPTNRRAELGFALGRTHWGQGYARTAATAVLNFAFEKLNLHRVGADTDPRNDASIRLLQKLGFRREGLLREHYQVTGEIQDALLFGLLRREWQANESPPARNP
jgi:ribosomal-protein-alanine N-acetyltransferase